MSQLTEAISRLAAGLTDRRSARLVRDLVEHRSHTSPSQLKFLTARERQILLFLTQGIATAEISRELAISVHTARTHIQHILTKLGVHSKLEAAAYAVRNGLA
jgi:two-component system nitrate/nitrite response regulator NarL